MKKFQNQIQAINKGLQSDIQREELSQCIPVTSILTIFTYSVYPQDKG